MASSQNALGTPEDPLRASLSSQEAEGDVPQSGDASQVVNRASMQNGEPGPPANVDTTADPLTPRTNMPEKKGSTPRLSSTQSSKSNSSPQLEKDRGGSGSSVSSLAPQDSFTDQFLASAARLKSSIMKTEPLSFRDIASNPTLGRRARAEINSHQLKGALEGAMGDPAKRAPHDMEVARLQVCLDAVESDADEESKVCAQLARAIILRLDSSRRAVERLLGILQAVSAAEAAYTRAMNAVSRVTLNSESDGPLLKTALLRLSDIPFSLSQSHQAIASGMSDITRGCQDAVRDMRKEWENTAHGSKHAASAVVAARKNLHSAFVSHRAACSTADSAVMQPQKSHRSSGGRIEMDPWLSEAKVVAVQATLLNLQKEQRAVLDGAFKQVLHHEGHRVEMLKDIVHSFLHSYKLHLSLGAKDEQSMLKVLDDLDSGEDLAQFTASVKACQDTCRDLSERQSQSLESTSQDLLCSPDIIRQGQMARWISGSGKWADCHFVLTRSGFLHWLTDAESYTPLGSLNLPKCQFETGEAPKFHIIETASGYTGFFGKAKKMMFEAPSVEECCEWAIAIRESIASHKA